MFNEVQPVSQDWIKEYFEGKIGTIVLDIDSEEREYWENILGELRDE